jgi:hypothetical protein
MTAAPLSYLAGNYSGQQIGKTLNPGIHLMQTGHRRNSFQIILTVVNMIRYTLSVRFEFARQS